MAPAIAKIVKKKSYSCHSYHELHNFSYKIAFEEKWILNNIVAFMKSVIESCYYWSGQVVIGTVKSIVTCLSAKLEKWSREGRG